MKKLLRLITIISIVSVAQAITIGVEAGAGYTLADGPNPVFISGSALINIYKNFYLRTQLINLTLVSGKSYISIGTGQSGIGLTARPTYGIDLMMFSREPFTPYGLGGFNITTGGGTTKINIRLGIGSEFEIGSAFKPFAEVDLDVNRTSNSSSNTNLDFTFKGGFRLK